MNNQPPNPELAALPDLFLLNPENRAFIEGKTQRIKSWGFPMWTQHSLLLFSIFAFVIPAIIVVGLPDHNLMIGVAVGTFLTVALIAFLIGFTFKNRHRLSDLLQYGQLLQGEVTSYVILAITHDYGETYKVELEYVFHTSAGQKLTAKKTVPMSRLPDDIPKQGRPLAVLYVKDRLYEVL